MRAARARPQATAGGEDDTGLFPRKTRHRPCLVLAARHPCQTSPQGASPGRRALRLLFHLFICCGCVRAGGSGRAPVEVRAYCCLQVHSVHKNITDIQCTVYHTIVRRSNPSRLLGGHARRFGRPRLRHRARLLVGCHPQRWMGGASETSRRRSPHSCTRGDPRLLRRPGARAHARGALPAAPDRPFAVVCATAAAASVRLRRSSLCLDHGRVQLCRSRDTWTCASTTRSKQSRPRTLCGSAAACVLAAAARWSRPLHRLVLVGTSCTVAATPGCLCAPLGVGGVSLAADGTAAAADPAEAPVRPRPGRRQPHHHRVGRLTRKRSRAWNSGCAPPAWWHCPPGATAAAQVARARAPRLPPLRDGTRHTGHRQPQRSHLPPPKKLVAIRGAARHRPPPASRSLVAAPAAFPPHPPHQSTLAMAGHHPPPPPPPPSPTDAAHDASSRAARRAPPRFPPASSR